MAGSGHVLGISAVRVSEPLLGFALLANRHHGSTKTARCLGVDFGTWIGEEEENRAWALLGQTRDALARVDVTPETAPAAFEAAYTAEGSDWFWWFGEDQESGHDEEFDELFRLHLKNVYRGLNAEPATALDRPIVPHPTLWTFTSTRTACSGGRSTHGADELPGDPHLAAG